MLRFIFDVRVLAILLVVILIILNKEVFEDAAYRYAHNNQVAYTMEDAKLLMDKCNVDVREDHRCVPAISIRVVKNEEK